MLEAEPDVCVDGGGDADVGVSEGFLDDDEFDAPFQEQGGRGVSEVVEADAAGAGIAQERGVSINGGGSIARPPPLIILEVRNFERSWNRCLPSLVRAFLFLVLYTRSILWGARKSTSGGPGVWAVVVQG